MATYGGLIRVNQNFAVKAMLLGIGLLAAGSAGATPVTYDVVMGGSSNVDLFATNANTGATLVSGGVLPMTNGSLVEFDSAAQTLPTEDFQDTGPTNIALQGPLAGDSLQITNFNVAPTTGYSSTVTSTGTNSYNFTVNDVLATGNWVLLNSMGQPVKNQSGSFNHVVATFNGQFATSGDMLENLTLTGISLGQQTIAGTPVNITADVEFNGMQAVPLPPGLWLLASALAALGLLAVRGRARATAPRAGFAAT
jgi:hypothetical protein